MAAASFGPLGDALLNYGTIAFLIAAVIELAFLIHYVVVAPAFKSWIGWMFVLRSGSFLFAGLAILLGRILGPDYPLRPYVTAVLFAFVLVSAAVTYGVFLRERARNRRTRPRPGGGLIGWTRRALGISGHRRAQAAPDSEDEPKLRIVEDRTA